MVLRFQVLVRNTLFVSVGKEAKARVFSFFWSKNDFGTIAECRGNYDHQRLIFVPAFRRFVSNMISIYCSRIVHHPHFYCFCICWYYFRNTQLIPRVRKRYIRTSILFEKYIRSGKATHEWLRVACNKLTRTFQVDDLILIFDSKFLFFIFS